MHSMVISLQSHQEPKPDYSPLALFYVLVNCLLRMWLQASCLLISSNFFCAFCISLLLEYAELSWIYPRDLTYVNYPIILQLLSVPVAICKWIWIQEMVQIYMKNKKMKMKKPRNISLNIVMSQKVNFAISKALWSQKPILACPTWVTHEFQKQITWTEGHQQPFHSYTR